MFHLEQAAACGDLQALITMAEIHLQLPHDILASATVQVITQNFLLQNIQQLTLVCGSCGFSGFSHSVKIII